VPGIAFASNFLWVLVMGLLGPSLPAIVTDLGISYAQAGFLFTLLSLGALFGTTVGATLSDSVPRKILLGVCALSLGIGLAVFGLMPTYFLVAFVVFLLSLLGSPIGAVSQSIMLSQFPDKREKFLSLMTMFAAVGSIVGPIIVSINYSASLSWRWVFREAAVLPLILFAAVLVSRLPRSAPAPRRQGVLSIARNPTVLGCALAIFVSVAVDIGFSYWLAEYFKSALHVRLALSSAVVSIYLVGIITSRALVPALLKRMRPRGVLVTGLSLSLAAIILFLAIPYPVVKAALCALYGLGIGPVFPLLMARGSREYPAQPGAVSGLLFGSLSLGGMVFPLLIGALATRVGLERSYIFPAVVAAGLLIAMVLWRDAGAGRERSAS
jgi:MFS family permease